MNYLKEFTNSIICGNCLNVMEDIPDKSIDMILCDLPYGTTKCKWDVIIPFDCLWEHYKRIIKPNGAIVLTATQPFTSLLITSNLAWFKYCWTWDKVTAREHLVAKIRPMQQTEDIAVFGAKRINYYPQMIDRPSDKIEVRKTRECKRTEIMGGKKGVLKEKIYDKWYPKTIIKISNAGS